MLDTVREINEKRRSSVIVMESGETFWLTWTQLQEHEPFAVGQEVDTDALREWLLPRQYPMALNDAVALLAQRAQASGEIRQKLKRKLYMEDTIEMVLYKLEKSACWMTRPLPATGPPRVRAVRWAKAASCASCA